MFICPDGTVLTRLGSWLAQPSMCDCRIREAAKASPDTVTTWERVYIHGLGFIGVVGFVGMIGFVGCVGLIGLIARFNV